MSINGESLSDPVEKSLEKAESGRESVDSALSHIQDLKDTLSDISFHKALLEFNQEFGERNSIWGLNHNNKNINKSNNKKNNINNNNKNKGGNIGNNIYYNNIKKKANSQNTKKILNKKIKYRFQNSAKKEDPDPKNLNTKTLKHKKKDTQKKIIKNQKLISKIKVNKKNNLRKQKKTENLVKSNPIKRLSNFLPKKNKFPKRRFSKSRSTSKLKSKMEVLEELKDPKKEKNQKSSDRVKNKKKKNNFRNFGSVGKKPPKITKIKSTSKNKLKKIQPDFEIILENLKSTISELSQWTEVRLMSREKSGTTTKWLLRLQNTAKPEIKYLGLEAINTEPTEKRNMRFRRKIESEFLADVLKIIHFKDPLSSISKKFSMKSFGRSGADYFSVEESEKTFRAVVRGYETCLKYFKGFV